MPVIKGYIDPLWHESNLIILILNQDSLYTKELFEKIREEQRKSTVLGEREKTHSQSAYRYWLKRRENQWIITMYGDKLGLTPLGRWIANSNLGTFLNRNDFVELMCPECSNPGNLAVLKPQLGTAETNKSGRLFMDVNCPRCQYGINRVPMTVSLTKEEFITFYNNAVMELKRLLNIQADTI